MTIEQKRRELFEAIWHMPANCIRCGKTYAATSHSAWSAMEFISRWEGFNAALDAVVIQCPTTYSREYNRSERSYNEGVSDFKEAVESVGLGLKVIIQ